ncbi:acetylornithine deacetylase [Palleronia sp. KMU-117]|uniref:acetylornithine deacetylase n=1 Tax=Palleronia sp. KMU-117 TaxID=3434108 RepID=UPI003D738D44
MDTLSACVETLRRLVAFPTVSSDGNRDLIAFLAERAEAAGARVEVMTDATGAKANLWATFGPEVDGGLVLSGHTDVVPVEGQDWSSDPFVLREAGGRLYARGTCDMKGFIAAVMTVLPDLAASARVRPIHLAFTYDEEVGCFGARHLVEILRPRATRPAMAIVGEPTSLRIIDGHKGCCEYTTRFTGLDGHGSRPDLGVNAIDYALRYATRLLALGDDLASRPPPGSAFSPPWTTVNIGRIEGGTARNVIAGQAQLEWEMRPVDWADAAWVKEALARYCEATLLPAMRTIAPQAAIETEVVGEVRGLDPRNDNPARDLVASVLGANGTDLAAFGTEAGLFQDLGLSVVLCGPGRIDEAHKPDEFIEIAQLDRALHTLRGVAAAFARG